MQFLNLDCYWTHFHKRPTIKGEKDLRFSYNHGEICAGNWFDYEYSTYNLNGKILILLGQDLQRYYREHKRDHPIFGNNHVICLPHPSPANVGSGWSWNPNKPEGNENKKMIISAIEKLVSSI